MVKKLCMVFLLLLLLSLPSFGMAAEITTAELEQWQMELQLQDTLLSKAEISNQKSQLELAALREQLKTSETELLQLTTLLEELRQESKDSEMRWQNAEQALDAANSYLKKYASEQKRTQARIKRQRTIAWCVAGVVAIYAVKK